MSGPADALAVADWRRRTAELYQRVRRRAALDGMEARRLLEAGRDALIASHPASPLGDRERQTFTGLRYHPYRAEWRLSGRVERLPADDVREVELGADGSLRTVRVARAHFRWQAEVARLDLFWVTGYGGGLFLPFGDETNAETTFGGGRYLYDTIKGADLGAVDSEILLDFNFAYNPSCAYDDRWTCPLAPAENVLPFRVEAGELTPFAG